MNNKEEVKALTLFHRRCKTIGINGLTQETFVKYIKTISKPCVFEFYYKQPREKIFIGKRILVGDIRSNPFVKKDFKPNDLIELGKKKGFHYRKYEYLGNPFYKRHLKEKNPESAKREYQAYVLGNPNAQTQFKELFAELERHQIVFLMCYCPVKKPRNRHDPGECHRFWLSELLEKQKRVELNKIREINSKIGVHETKIEVLKI